MAEAFDDHVVFATRPAAAIRNSPEPFSPVNIGIAFPLNLSRRALSRDHSSAD